MSAQYSDSTAPFLAVDSASPTLSVAVGRQGETLAYREAPAGRSAPSLLRLIDEVLAEANIRMSDLGGALGIRGPGSFTGLRVGLSTLLGLHRSLGLPATAIPTFLPLAWQAKRPAGAVVAVIDALRGEWFSQRFRRAGAPEAVEEPVLRSPAALAELGAITLVGFDLDGLARQLPAASVVAARPLAPRLIELAAALPIDWDPRLLTEPLYLRSAATTPPRSPA